MIRAQHTLVALGCAAVSSFAAGTLHADPLPRSGRWQLSIPVQVIWHTDPAYEVFRRNHTGAPGIMVARDFTPVDGPLSIGVDLGYQNEDFTSTVGQAMATHLTSDWITAGVQARWALRRWLEPYARLSGGALHQRATISTWNSQTLESTTWTPFGALGAGVMVRSAAVFYGSGLGRLGFSFSLEGGYVLSAPIDHALSPTTPTDEALAADQIRVRATPIGAINPSGPYLRAVFGLRF